MTEAQALALACAFGIFYNWLITRWGRSQWGDGFTALWVVIGVAADAADFDVCHTVPAGPAAFDLARRSDRLVECPTCRLV